ncbi:MAG: tRNA 2-thiouridine(34) synthase MnmA [Candidatus Portnoybacteria bacterium]|nr:tRNA 2-thiouridine(34) synthase MnmA [Candidatus Portnoybacteria bacterium]MDD4982433.1 tRNA 2-thiouridine(34) synthase MnmA [Candidatus Portnoybacteria bacterium]
MQKNEGKMASAGLSPRLRSGKAGGAGKRVFVGLSGGVDSSVAAALLKEQGYDVAGVFMRFWKPRIDADLEDADLRGSENACCSAESEAAARLVAGKLGIPFYIFDFSKEFKREVVDYFLAELRAGRTPNPCVVCNPRIKFGLFLARAKKLGADYIATGHYAQIKSMSVILSEAKNLRRMSARMRGRSFAIAQDDSLGYKLFTAKDKQKDQSYFLHLLNQGQISRVLFPLGGYTKEEVYGLAKKWQLPHQAHQSFDICFAGDYNAFLKKHLKLKPGKIIFASVIPAPHQVRDKLEAGIQGPGSRVKPGMTKESILGQHAGLPLFTIGQRASIGGPGPFYVVKKDPKKNILYVSSNKKDLLQKEMFVGDINWVSGNSPKLPLSCKVKIRYQGKGARAAIRLRSGHKSFVVFAKPQRAVTPGQSAVLYKGGEVLGGGIIL